MKKAPLPVLIVAIALMLAGVFGFFYHLKDFADDNQKIYVTVLVELLRIIAIVSGVLLLRSNNIGRWLSVAWVLLHVVTSAFNSLNETIMHVVVLMIVTVLLYLPVSSAWFKKQLI
ncbi:hypothetical protein BH11BAC5_BH11BAC5_22950 [soil metagenome]